MCYQYVSTSPPKMSWSVKDRGVWGTGTHRWGHQLVNNVGALSTWLSRESNLLSWDIDFSISFQKEGIVAPLEVTVWFRAISRRAPSMMLRPWWRAGEGKRTEEGALPIQPSHQPGKVGSSAGSATVWLFSGPPFLACKVVQESVEA